MEAADITAVFFASEEVPMALLFGPEAIVPGRRCAITSLGATFDRPKVLEALKTLFPSHLQIIVWKSAENNPISIESCSLEEMEAAIAFKAREKPVTCWEILRKSLTFLNFSFLLL